MKPTPSERPGKRKSIFAKSFNSDAHRLPSSSLVMLRNLHILGAVFAEYEAEPPLLVDADAVLSMAISASASSRLLGGTRKSSRLIAASSCCSLASARFRMSGGCDRTGSSTLAAPISPPDLLMFIRGRRHSSGLNHLVRDLLRGTNGRVANMSAMVMRAHEAFSLSREHATA